MLAVILNQHLIKRRKQEEYKTAHSSPPDYETKNIVSSSDGVSCAEKDEQKAIILNGTKIVSLNEETIRHLACKPHQRLTESWTVRGHYRHYASGKVGFVKPYTKGTGKKTAKTYKLAETI